MGCSRTSICWKLLWMCQRIKLHCAFIQQLVYRFHTSYITELYITHSRTNTKPS
ncbi:hypothetical protein PF010_g17526 [Phytophthora fragariae]|uniref:Uncharacterized protein n=1 Tax=Phytophthora fragariae TaxID=53985 RepID=A0A6G0KND4_9STRA|nr:hypothetical protein PF010_g17526 [Phytophthora fragariae]KAE9206096.1 hypothetical protein PF004_g17393 [Phytophthora fragariae]